MLIFVLYIANIFSGSGEMADTLDLGSSAERRAGSSPAPGTMGLILGIGVHSASINRDPGPDVVVCKKFF